MNENKKNTLTAMTTLKRDNENDKKIITFLEQKKYKYGTYSAYIRMLIVNDMKKSQNYTGYTHHMKGTENA